MAFSATAEKFLIYFCDTTKKHHSAILFKT